MGYNGKLLELAIDLADRLMPAFDTPTGIPYGTVHLQHGVPEGETPEACTSAAGSLSLEFGLLSAITGDPKYGVSARNALRSIFELRSSIDLVGRHINVRSGAWTEPLAGIGPNIDSLYEYYLKHYILFGDDAAIKMFTPLYHAAVKYLKVDDRWYGETDLLRGRFSRKVFNNLQAFWPGLQTLTGDIAAASKTANAFLSVWNDFGYTPEDFSFVTWNPALGDPVSKSYPLRPELAESVFYLHEATSDDSWILAGKDILNSLLLTEVDSCPGAFASVSEVNPVPNEKRRTKDMITMRQQEMDFENQQKAKIQSLLQQVDDRLKELDLSATELTESLSQIASERLSGISATSAKLLIES